MIKQTTIVMIGNLRVKKLRQTFHTNFYRNIFKVFWKCLSKADLPVSLWMTPGGLIAGIIRNEFCFCGFYTC